MRNGQLISLVRNHTFAIFPANSSKSRPPKGHCKQTPIDTSHTLIAHSCWCNVDWRIGKCKKRKANEWLGGRGKEGRGRGITSRELVLTWVMAHGSSAEGNTGVASLGSVRCHGP